MKISDGNNKNEFEYFATLVIVASPVIKGLVTVTDRNCLEVSKRSDDLVFLNYNVLYTASRDQYYGVMQ